MTHTSNCGRQRLCDYLRSSSCRPYSTVVDSKRNRWGLPDGEAKLDRSRNAAIWWNPGWGCCSCQSQCKRYKRWVIIHFWPSYMTLHTLCYVPTVVINVIFGVADNRPIRRSGCVDTFLLVEPRQHIVFKKAKDFKSTYSDGYGSPKQPCIHIFYFLHFPVIIRWFSRNLVITKLCFPEITK